MRRCECGHRVHDHDGFGCLADEVDDDGMTLGSCPCTLPGLLL